ncbi:hypothetical protein JW921_06460 [Candidatus Fermentibacterales bacterium]|nr:hypothetical protein [Candidatus Fermentibacterales bacterium]
MSRRAGLLATLAIATGARAAHWLLYLSYPPAAVHYWPVLGAMRFETSALQMLAGTPQTGPLVYASPLYRHLILPFYALGSGRTPLLVFQTIVGIVTAAAIYTLCFHLVRKTWLSLLIAACWSLYPPVLFYELTVLPVSIAALTLLVISVLLMDWKQKQGLVRCCALGLLIGLAAGMRPPFIALALPAAYAVLRERARWASRLGRTCCLLLCAGLPLLPTALHQSRNWSGFYPFPRATGLTLILGHNDDATGFGPPAPSVGLVESGIEDLRSVSLRVAAEHGANSPVLADRYWTRLALQWIARNPGRELGLLLGKAGAFFGLEPFDVYYDLGRLGRSNPLFRFLVIPRGLLVALFCIGLVPFLAWWGRPQHRLALGGPALLVLLSSLVFVHSERYSLPILPQMLLLGGCGVAALLQRLRASGETVPGARLGTICVAASGLLLMVPALLRPVPEVAEGGYFYTLGASAFSMGDAELALTLFERSALVSPEGSHYRLIAHESAAVVARSLGREDEARAHEELAGLR